MSTETHDRIYFSNRLLEVQRGFAYSSYSHLVEQASKAYVGEEWKKLKLILEKFPTDYVLLEALVAKLKGKSVYANMKKIITGASMTKEDQAIAVSSLTTHTLIEMKTNPEYKILLSNLYKKLGVLIDEK